MLVLPEKFIGYVIKDKVLLEIIYEKDFDDIALYHSICPCGFICVVLQL